MLDIKYIRENKEEVKKACLVKNRPVDIDRLLVLDDKRIELMVIEEALRAERNRIGKLEEKDINKGRQLKEKIKKAKEEFAREQK